jgi:hypothetical protein
MVSGISVVTEMNDSFPPVVGFAIDAGVPRWVVMWGVALAMFAGAKAVTLWEMRRQGRKMRPGRTAAYVLLWVGMDARDFWGGREGNGGWIAAAIPGIAKLGIGALLLWEVAPMFQGVAAGWIGMVGMVLVLHFGLFHLLAVFWARRGVAVKPIMNRPMCARTLSEFWGERWNRAFSTLMHRFVFRRAVRRAGVVGGMWVVFLASGVIHDLVISGPAGGGYGKPTIYFVVQGLGLMAQRSELGRAMGLTEGSVARAFTALVLIAPLPLLFHDAFIMRIILPFMDVIGAGTAEAIGG